MRRRAALLALASLVMAPDTLAEDRRASTVEIVGNDIVVTARLHEERLIDAPLAITVRSGDGLDMQHVHTLEDLAQFQPSLSFRSAASNKDRTLFIRGVGTATTSSGAEPAVATVLDDVLLLRPGQQTLEVADIERVELLKGPQGTLFGKNASAGVIRFATNAPTAYWSSNALAEVTSDGEQRIKAALGGPLAPDTTFRLSALATRFDGNARNLATGDEVNGYRRAGARARLQLDPSAMFRITATGDYAVETSDTPYAIYSARQRIAFGSNAVSTNPALDAALAAEGLAASPDNRLSRGTPTRVEDRNGGVSLKADLELPLGAVTSISAARWWRNRQRLDLDGFDEPLSGIPGIADKGRVRFAQLSQELRLSARNGDAFEYVAGLYLLRGVSREDYRRAVSQLLSPGAVQVDAGLAAWKVATTHYSLFGEATLRLVPGLHALLGGRLIRDKLHYRHERTLTTIVPVPGIFPPHASQGGTSRNDYSLRAGLRYSPSTRVTAYATFTRGYKGPAINTFFNMRTLDEQPLAPETSLGGEAGLKGEAFDRRLSFAIDAFLTRYHGFQANFADVYLGTPVTRLINAGSVSTRGVELELGLRIDAGLSFTLDAAHVDAHIDHFRCPPASTLCSAFSIDGKPLPYAPKWQVFAAVDADRKLSSGLAGLFSIDVAYVSAMQVQLDQSPDTIQPGHARLDASVGLRTHDSRYELRLFGRNLTDDRYSSYELGNAGGGGLVRIIPRDERRYFGVTLVARR